MNQVFSFKRFGMLLKKHTVENFRGHLMSLFVLMAILVTVLTAVSYAAGKPLSDDQIISGQAVLFVAFLFAAGTLFTSTMFTNLSDKRKAIATLTLPCSSFEKFFVGWLYSYIIFQVVYIIAFYIIVVPMMHVGNWRSDHLVLNNVFNNSANDASITFVAYAFLHSVVFFGAVYFKKMHFIKTAFAFFIIIMAIWLLNDEVLRLMIHHKTSGNPPFTGIDFTEGISQQSIKLNWENMVIALFGILSVIMWCATYFRLKEKQV
jgi:hypothetical protein